MAQHLENMKSREENKYSMYLAVKKVLITNTAIWSGILGFASVVALFFAKLLLLKATDNKRTKKTKGITTDKKNKKVQLIDAIMAVAGAIKSFANDINDQDLFQTVNFTRSELETMNDSVLEEKGTLVFEVATLHAADIVPKGIDAAALVNFNTLIVEYGNLVQAPRNAISNKKTAGAALINLFLNIDDLLHNNLDQLMQQFKITQPEFYGDYFNNRKIVDLGTHHTRLSGVITDSEGNPLYQAVVRAQEADLVTETDLEGEYMFIPFTAGIFTITVEKEGFETITQELVEVGVGEHVELDFVMQREVVVITINGMQVGNVFGPSNPRWVVGAAVKIKNITPGPAIGGGHFYPADSAVEGWNGMGTPILPGEEVIHTVSAAEFKAFMNGYVQGPNAQTFEITIL